MRTRLLSHQREIHAMRKYHGRSYLEQKIFSLLLVSKLESLVTPIFLLSCVLFTSSLRKRSLFFIYEIKIKCRESSRERSEQNLIVPSILIRNILISKR